ncbi:uncharacterized protein [Antedon mediterranea]|uniref:uncharacterized protein n=1 Tax=Antedon mediterranea TaxID=105859 RepID=UPI003AF7014E
MQCPETSECVASEIRVQRVYLVGEPQVFDVVQDCECVHTPPSCERKSQIKMFFADTPYETEVDVGMCAGTCSDGDGLECKSTENRTVTIEGPNGAFCVDVIEACKCQHSCYRATHREVYYEVIFNTTSNSTQTVIKYGTLQPPTTLPPYGLMIRADDEMDIGKCIGTCSQDASLQCILRSPSNPDECLMSLTKKTNCSPQSYHQHNFQTTGNRRQTVLTIRDCGC